MLIQAEAGTHRCENDHPNTITQPKEHLGVDGLGPVATVDEHIGSQREPDGDGWVIARLDSVPAVFGLTQNTFIVFTATAFSLLGLRQLYFLIDGLLDRLIYLSCGIAGILGFIGEKLILHALHENNVPFINDSEPVPVVEIGTGLSLSVILGVLVVTVAASLRSPAGKAQNAIANARRHATSYLDSEYTADPVERERIFGCWPSVTRSSRSIRSADRKSARNPP